MKIVDTKLGAEGDVAVEFTAGVIKITVSETTAGLTGGLNVSLPVTYFVDALVKKLGSSPMEVAVGKMLDGILTSIP